MKVPNIVQTFAKIWSTYMNMSKALAVVLNSRQKAPAFC
jgi:hypothetical protein